MSDIFLSYAREDQAKAKQLADAMTAFGWSVFWDRKIPPGMSWRQVLARELPIAKCIVVAWSSASVDSHWVCEEAEEGSSRKVLVPVLFESVVPPYGFRTFQAANLVEWDGDHQSEVISELVGGISPFLGLPVRQAIGLDSPIQLPLVEAKIQPSIKIIRYNGKKELWRDNTYKTGLTFTPGQERDVKDEHADLLLRHPDIFEDVTPVDSTNIRLASASRATFGQTERKANQTQTERKTPTNGPPRAKAPPKQNQASSASDLKDLAIFRDRLKDGSEGPEMIVIPAGQFRMGDLSGKGLSDERPVRTVQIANPFAIGRYTVTFDEYDRFARATGRKLPSDYGWGRGRRPVIHVTWHDAVAYGAWLSEQTGERYRLPSEAEWEYMARARTETEYWWGDAWDRSKANGGRQPEPNKSSFMEKLFAVFSDNSQPISPQWKNPDRTEPVGSFPANPWGLYDTSGNVWEWVQDRWHDSYEGAPCDGTPWEDGGNESRRVVRGGSWFSYPRILRSACRLRFTSGDAYYNLGFRLARAL